MSLSAESCGNFNCTIQELKPQKHCVPLRQALYFNCTIQELKLKEIRDDRINSNISIAPYRN